MKKKSIILTVIGIIAVAILTMFITSLAATYEVGHSRYIGIGYPETTLKKLGTEEKLTNAVNLMSSANYDYFCANHATKFGNTGFAIKHINYAKAEIKGSTTEIEVMKKLTQTSGVYKEAFEETTDEDEGNTTLALALLFYKIKDGEFTINDTNTIQRVRYYKEGNEIKGYKTLAYDAGQVAIWKNLKEWQTKVALKLDKNQQSMWGSVANSIQSEDVYNAGTEGQSDYHKTLTLTYNSGLRLYEEVKSEAKNAIDNEYGIEETYYKNSSPEKEPETQEEVGEYTILGPFKYNFVGDIKNGKPTLTFNESITPQEYIIGRYEGSTFTATNKIVSGNQFYIKVKTSLLANVQYINFNFQVEGISLYNTTTTLYFYIRENNADATQSIMYIEQEEGYNNPFKDTYKISRPVDITIEKLDASGNALKAEGIKFQIKDETNAVVAYFKTDANGNGIVTDANGNNTGATTVRLLTNKTYTLIESENNIYGYKKLSLAAGNIEIEGARIEQNGNNAIKFTLDNSSDSKVTIKAKNQEELANLEIEKVSEDGTKLENVKFLIKIGTREYLQLKDDKGEIVTKIKGEATINSSNKANSTEYHVAYVKDENVATKFVTDANGKIAINNLEVNKSNREKYDYTAYELYNPNYGYGSKENTSLKQTVAELKLNEVNQIKMSNIKALGNLELKKYDEDNHNIVLPDVEFVMEVSPSLEKAHAYLALYNQNGEIVSNVRGTATINSNNEASAERNEYRVSYYYSDKKYSELTDAEKANITILVTDDAGILKVNNLEVYSSKTGEKCTYKLIEISNSHYGYDIDAVELGNITLEKNTTTTEELGNNPVYTKISGYVWIENTSGKANNYDCIYSEGEGSTDIKLTDLYIIKDGKLVKNESATTPVEIKLRDKSTGEFIKTQPDQFEGNGKYTFGDIEIAKLSDYEVVFEYDGFYYTTTVEQLDKDNGSKVKEVAIERETLNNEFATVRESNEVVATDGTVNTVEYYKDGHTSTVSKLNFDTTISANTTQTGYDLKERYNTLKAEATEPVNEIGNLNMGIVLREQPQISINSDIYSVLVDFEGYKYNYKYNGRQNYYENKDNNDIGVKFEQEYTSQRYTRTVFASDIQAAKDQSKEIKVSITYKIQLSNQSRTLIVEPKQIINYFDARYDIKAIGLGLDETTHTITNELGYTNPPEAVADQPAYKSTVIDFNQKIESGNGNVKDLYITFDVQRDAILDLLDNKSTYHNASEILSYASYYGEGTSKLDEKQFITDTSKKGKLYAGIDKASQPGNMEIKLINHSTEEGTQILDATYFEDDTTSAPSLLLEAQESRKISGTIFEDVATVNANNEKLGDGIYGDGEKVISGVEVGLYKVDTNGNPTDTLATYSNGESVIATTGEDGTYTFGYTDEGNKKYVGVLPGKYVIKYTYNGQSYIIGSKNINPNDYKSTIITSEVIKNAFEGNNERWYAEQESNRYSDARDDVSLRPEYRLPEDITLTHSTYNNSIVIEKMNAYTPIMDIGIEFTKEDSADITFERIIELENVDFGIVERPDIDITIDKEITSLEIVAQNGSTIIPKGDPSDTNSRMQYVKKLDGLVSAEIEAKLLQGAQLNLEYTITVINNSNKDYLEKEYYYYGFGGITELTTRAKQVVDYMDATVSVDIDANKDVWVEVKAEDLYKEGNGYISENVYNELKTGNYHILTTTAFEDVGAGTQETIKLYATRTLASTDSIREENKVEILELTGKRIIKESIPGNYVPTEAPNEQDESEVVMLITPPTGTAVNYMLYIIAVIATLSVLVIGIVIIKKKIIK